MPNRGSEFSREIRKSTDQPGPAASYRPLRYDAICRGPSSMAVPEEQSCIQALAARSHAFGTSGYVGPSSHGESSQSTRQQEVSVPVPCGEGSGAVWMRGRIEAYRRNGDRRAYEVICEAIYKEELDQIQQQNYKREMQNAFVKPLQTAIVNPLPRRPQESPAAQRFEHEVQKLENRRRRAEIFPPLFAGIDVDEQIEARMKKYEKKREEAERKEAERKEAQRLEHRVIGTSRYTTTPAETETQRWLNAGWREEEILPHMFPHLQE